jgi:hypothetical protein
MFRKVVHEFNPATCVLLMYVVEIELQFLDFRFLNNERK